MIEFLILIFLGFGFVLFGLAMEHKQSEEIQALYKSVEEHTKDMIDIYEKMIVAEGKENMLLYRVEKLEERTSKKPNKPKTKKK